MSAQLAIAQPRCIKATHRRRRKVTAGRFVQRYYDPAIGRFLSTDPIPTDPNNGASFNRYAYANNSPYRFTDPDGRMVQDSNDDPFRIIGVREGWRPSSSCNGRNICIGEGSSASKSAKTNESSGTEKKPSEKSDVELEYEKERRKNGYVTQRKNEELGKAAKYGAKKTLWSIIVGIFVPARLGPVVGKPIDDKIDRDAAEDLKKTREREDPK